MTDVPPTAPPSPVGPAATGDDIPAPPAALPATSAVGPPARPRRRAALGAGLLAIVVLGAGVATVLTRTGRSPAVGATPQTAVDGYYRALHRHDARTAFSLLCAQQQAPGYAAFAANVTQDDQTGTGIRSWTRQGTGQVQGAAAVVPGRIVLDNNQATPLRVLLLRQAGGWRVCSSDLGGILPPPGGGAAPNGGGGSVAT